MSISKKFLEGIGATEEQINAIFAERGKEIDAEKEKAEKLQSDLKEKEKAIEEMTDKIKSFDGKDGALKDLQEKVANYEKEKSDREAAEAQAIKDAELKARFDAVKGEQKFNHELIENGRFEDFKKAVSDEKYKGKGDPDIFGDIVKPEDLVNPQRQTVTMPGGGGVIPTDLAKAKSYDEYKAIRKAQI